LSLNNYRESINYRIIREQQGKEFIEPPQGTGLPLMHQPIAGYWNVNRVRADLIEISGWAMNPETMKPSESVLVFVGDELVFLATVGNSRVDVARHFCNPDLENTGFACEIRLSGRRRPSISAIRIVAVAVGAAYELPQIKIESQGVRALWNLSATLRMLYQRLLNSRP